MSQNKRKENAKGELEVKQNELQAMLNDSDRLLKRIYETEECGKSGCDARCSYNAFCEAAHITFKLIKRQADLYK